MIGRMCAIAGLAMLALPVPANAAKETGLDDLHSKVRVGGRLCFSDHYHSGGSSGEKSRKAAEIAAIRSWQNFTVWEYGSAWGSWSSAVSKTMDCGQFGGGWGCNINARPCRR